MVDYNVKLHNKGQRVIEIDGFNFRPDSVAAFPEKEAKKLLELYKGEVFDIEQSIAVFKEEVAEETEEKRGRGRPAKA